MAATTAATSSPHDGFPYRRILITGATSGIGRALTKRILQSRPSAHVIAVGRRTDRLASLVEEHRGGDDSRVTAVPFDVGDLASLPARVAELTARFPDLDAVVLNAGFQHQPDVAGNPDGVDLERCTEEMMVNYMAPLHMALLMLPHFRSLGGGAEEADPEANATSGSGSGSGSRPGNGNGNGNGNGARPCALIIVTSGLAITPAPQALTYSASKAALHSLTWTLRAALLSNPPLPSFFSHVRVIEIIPPAVQTELHTQQGLPAMGMLLDAFIEETWRGLEAGKEEIPVGPIVERYERAEGEKRRMFDEFASMVAGMRGKQAALAMKAKEEEKEKPEHEKKQ